MNVLEATITGEEIGQVRSLVNTITARRIADLTDQNQRRPSSEPLADEHEGDEDNFRPAQGSSPDNTTQVIADELVEQAMEGLNPDHRRVIELGAREHERFEGRPAKEVASEIGSGMSEANVHQVLSRFRARLKQIIIEAENA
jgi:RNA polymerase sigma factor (sigma-70 family)